MPTKKWYQKKTPKNDSIVFFVCLNSLHHLLLIECTKSRLQTRQRLNTRDSIQGKDSIQETNRVQGECCSGLLSLSFNGPSCHSCIHKFYIVANKMHFDPVPKEKNKTKVKKVKVGHVLGQKNHEQMLATFWTKQIMSKFWPHFGPNKSWAKALASKN